MSIYVKMIFTFSIMLNLLVAGAAGTYVAKNWGSYFGGSDSALYNNLSGDSKEFVAGAVKQARKDMAKEREGAKFARKELVSVLTADKFDGEAYDKAMSNIHGYRISMMKKVASKTREIAEKLPPEERKKFARRIVKKLDGGAGAGKTRPRDGKKMHKRDNQGFGDRRERLKDLPPEMREKIRNMSPKERREFIKKRRELKDSEGLR